MKLHPESKSFPKFRMYRIVNIIHYFANFSLNKNAYQYDAYRPLTLSHRFKQDVLTFLRSWNCYQIYGSVEHSFSLIKTYNWILSLAFDSDDETRAVVLEKDDIKNFKVNCYMVSLFIWIFFLLWFFYF